MSKSRAGALIAALAVCGIVVISFQQITSNTKKHLVAQHSPIIMDHVTDTDHVVNWMERRYLFPEDLVVKMLWFNKTVSEDADSLAAEWVYFKHVNKLQVECRYRARLGSDYPKEGAWDVCLVGPYKPGPNCLVYDFGVKDIWSFDDVMADTYGCTVRAFDPTMDKPEMVRGDRIFYYPIGIAGRNTDTEFKIGPVRTMKTLMEMYGDQDRIIDYLKIDVDFSEWDSFENMIKDGFLEKQVKQIGLEVHAHKHSRTDLYRRYIDILNGLQAQGFVQWHNHWNPMGTYNLRAFQYFSTFNEIYFININFLPILD